jgi:hypothetical protein
MGRQQRCLHSRSIYSIKAYIGEILCILARQEDLQIQSMIRDEYVIAKLLDALVYCLRSPKVDWLNEGEKTESGVREYRGIVESGVVDLSSVTAYDQLEAIFHLSAVGIQYIAISITSSCYTARKPSEQSCSSY